MTRTFSTKKIYVGLAAILLSAVSYAQETTGCGQPADYSWISEALLKHSGQASKIVSVKPAGALGLCELRSDSGPVLYSVPGTRKVMVGQLYSFTNSEIIDLTQLSNQEQTRALLSEVKPEDYIAYTPSGPVTATMYVLVDADCQFCHKMHEQISQLNQRGIEVRYLPFVRGGRKGAAWSTMSGVWCAKDRKQAMDLAYQSKSIPAAAECEPILEKYQTFGRKIMLQGTPFTVFADGSTLAGYSPLSEIAEKALAATSEVNHAQAR
nr:DsbC family protein [Pseudomonas luteola]